MSKPDASTAQKNYLISLAKRAGDTLTMDDLTWTDVMEASQKIRWYKNWLGLLKAKETLTRIEDLVNHLYYLLASDSGLTMDEELRKKAASFDWSMILKSKDEVLRMLGEMEMEKKEVIG